jgi:hypothetical protein
MTVKVEEAHTHVQRLISVVKMATVIEVRSTEEKHSVVRLFVVTRTEHKKY